jgi:formate dehydrogenase subunit gamma
LWTTIHAVLAVVFVAAMLAHAYIGSVGMEGAFDAMGTGEVDLNWAKEHHSLWVAEELAKGKTPVVPPRAMPAE